MRKDQTAEFRDFHREVVLFRVLIRHRKECQRRVSLACPPRLNCGDFRRLIGESVESMQVAQDHLHWNEYGQQGECGAKHYSAGICEFGLAQRIRTYPEN